MLKDIVLKATVTGLTEIRGYNVEVPILNQEERYCEKNKFKLQLNVKKTRRIKGAFMPTDSSKGWEQQALMSTTTIL